MEGSGKINTEFILIAGSAVMLLLTTSIVIFIYLFQRKLIKRRLAYQKIEELLKKQELNSAYAILEGQEKERNRIASEIHDNLGNITVTLSMFADTLIKKKTIAEKDKIASEIANIARHASDETRRISHSLHSGILKHFGLSAAIKDLFDAVDKVESISTELHMEMAGALNSEYSLNIYRVIQELVNNTLKHAKASVIRLDITQIENEYLNIIYEDNGIGFIQNDKTGLGFKNLKSRIESMGGTITIDSKLNKGTTTIVEIPLNNENN